MIRIIKPTIDLDDLDVVCKILSSGFLVQGPKIKEFEDQIAHYVGTKYAIAVSNCTAALHLSLLALHVGPGDKVIIPAYSYPATANVVELCGAQPIFVDIQPDSFNMDSDVLKTTLEKLMNHIETQQKIKAIMPVHTFGQLADMPIIMEIANNYHIPLIEDAACALGASQNDVQAGRWGDLGCFSFHPRKILTTGEGGMIATENQKHANYLRALRNHGQDFNASSPDFVFPGFNYRLTEFQGALGLSQLAKLDRLITVRNRLAAHYDALLQDTPFTVPCIKNGQKSVYQSYVILLPNEIKSQRNQLITYLKQKGIETTIGTYHIPLTSYYRHKYGYQIGDFPVTDHVFASALTLPLYDSLSFQDQEIIIKELNSFS